jgi:hypothetical protein
VVLGNPRLADVRDRANLKADADRFAKNVAPIIREIQSTGVASHRAIAHAALRDFHNHPVPTPSDTAISRLARFTGIS